MSEEIAQAAGDIAYWKQRAEQAEADAAALRAGLVALQRHAELDNRIWAFIASDALETTQAGAALLVELKAARAVVTEALTIPRAGELSNALDGLNRLFAVIDAFGLAKKASGE